MLFDPLFLLLVPPLLGVGWAMRSRHQRAQAVATALEELGYTPEVIDETLRVRTQARDGAPLYIDVSRSRRSGDPIFCVIDVHVHLPDFLPPGHTFELRGSGQTHLGKAPLFSRERVLELTCGESRARLDGRRALEQICEEGLRALLELEAYELEPISRVRYAEGWLSIERTIFQRSLTVRKLSKPRQITGLIQGLIHQMVSVTDAWRQGKSDPGELWYELFRHAEAFSRGREDALATLLRHHGNTPMGQACWEYVIEQGNFYDLLHVINYHQRRALEELSEERLVAFINTVLEQRELDPSRLPDLMSRRMSFDALLNSALDWRGRSGLLQLWLRTSDGEVAALSENMVEMIVEASPAQRIDLLEIVKRDPWWGSRDMLLRLSPGEDEQGNELLAGAWLATCRTLAPEGRSDARATRALLRLLERHPSPTVVEALGWVGEREAVERLHALDQAHTMRLGRMAQVTRRAIERLIERLGAQMRGGLSVSHTDEQGQLSLTEDEGSLTIVAAPHQDPIT